MTGLFDDWSDLEENFFGRWESMESPEYRSGERHRIFVYGTMKRGFRNHFRLLRGRTTKFLGDATTIPEFTLETKDTMGGYTAPVMVKGGRHAVRGEVFEIAGPVLREVDICEGHPITYKRVPIRLMHWDEPIQTYLYMKPLEGHKHSVMIQDDVAWFI